MSSMKIKILGEVRLPCHPRGSEVFDDGVARLVFVKRSGIEGFCVTDYPDDLNDYNDFDLNDILTTTVELAVKRAVDRLKERWAWVYAGEACHFCEKRRECLDALESLKTAR